MSLSKEKNKELLDVDPRLLGIYVHIKVDPDTASESCMFFVWPLDLVHVIDEDSPFYDISAADLARERFELLVIMEGTIETSSMNFQAR